MQAWLVIAIASVIASLILYAYSLGYVAFLPFLGNVWSIVQFVINSRKEPAIVFTGIRRKPVDYQIGEGRMEARKGYFLILNRRGNERPEESAGRVQIDGKNIDNYTVWENDRKYSAINIDTLLKLFEISEIGEPSIIFHLFSDQNEEQYERIGRLDDYQKRNLTARISPKNAPVSKNYSKHISDIIKEGDKNDPTVNTLSRDPLN
jgi:hypothetical protein